MEEASQFYRVGTHDEGGFLKKGSGIKARTAKDGTQLAQTLLNGSDFR